MWKLELAAYVAYSILLMFTAVPQWVPRWLLPLYACVMVGVYGGIWFSFRFAEKFREFLRTLPRSERPHKTPLPVARSPLAMNAPAHANDRALLRSGHQPHES
jgi:hypothetical protein